jgi:hypothetical protein
MSHEHYAARRHPEFVILEIGQDLGALIVRTPASMHGLEIEISPEGDDDHRSHKQVLERTGGGESAYTAVFDQLACGTYTLWKDGVARVRGAEVGPGCVSELDWPRRTATVGT